MARSSADEVQTSTGIGGDVGFLTLKNIKESSERESFYG